MLQAIYMIDHWKKKLTATVSADKMGISDSQPTVPGPSDNLSDSPIPKAGDIDSPKNEDITIVAHTKTKKRKAGPVPVRKANLKRNVKQLITKIQNGKWLSDEHIDHAQAMLAKQYPGIGGLQAVCVFEPEGCQRVGTPEQNFIQVVNVSGNHWVTVSNVGCPKDTVAIYDSLYDDVSAMGKEKFLSQIAYMLMPTSKCMTLLWADMQKQTGTSDCGLFAIAAATSLCNDVLPQNCMWQQDRMREHLVRCIELGVMSPFSVSNTRESHEVFSKSEEVEVYCHCRQPCVKNVFMVECDICCEWFHRGCERVPSMVKKNTKFVCRNCK